MLKTDFCDKTAKSLEYLAPIADYFKVLSEISRQQILSYLRERAMHVSEIGKANEIKLSLKNLLL